MPQTVDPAFAKEVLEWWIEHADDALKDDRSGRREHEFCRSGSKTDVMLSRELQTRRVIGITLGVKVDALIRPLGQHNFVELQSGLDLARRAMGKLETAEETARHISGTVAPSMAADSLHPLIWDAASKLWNDGHLTAAVQRAATFLNAHVQDLSGRHDVSDSALMAQVFSPSAPEPEKPRLRWPGEDSNLTVRAMRTGLLQFSQGCFMAIRNPTTHGTAELSKQQALEHLAVLSTLARWIDGCDLVHAQSEARESPSITRG